jgi:2-dehydro-3-deoxyphosphogluconate aldolase/(4S)-4-hydroxy-2-oxoglutarate aldolase
MEPILAKLRQYKIVPVIAIDQMKDVLPLADALTAGGLPLIEITFRTEIAAQAIELINKERKDFFIGAGTVLTISELYAAIDNGAAFAVAPGFNPKIVEEAQRQDFPFFPGIMTPSDLEGALSFGVHIYKFFPAESAGGTKHLKSLAAPYGHKDVQFIPTGGVNTANLQEYLAIPQVVAVGGTWVAKTSDIAAGKWSDITQKCREAIDLVETGV